jgi:hypothetical protein
MAWVVGALPWLGALAMAVGLCVLFCYWPLRFDVNGRARGEADGSWVVAGGASIAFVALAFVGARGLRLQLNVLLFGHKLGVRLPRLGQRLSKPVPAPVKAMSRRAWGRVDPLGLALQLLEERRHLKLRYLVLDLAYGFRDPLLTGRLAGAISVLSAVLPESVELRHRPRWDFEDGWEVALDGRAFVRPWLMLLETAAYVVRRMLSRSAPRPEASVEPASNPYGKVR